MQGELTVIIGKDRCRRRLRLTPVIYIGERSWPRRPTPSRSARKDPWASSGVDQAASLIMSSHERDRLTRDHRDPEIALFLLCRETLDALILLTEANTLLLRIYLPRR